MCCAITAHFRVRYVWLAQIMFYPKTRKKCKAQTFLSIVPFFILPKGFAEDQLGENGVVVPAHFLPGCLLSGTQCYTEMLKSLIF